MKNTDPTFEIDRIRHLVVNFGWLIEKQKLSDDEITLTIVKKIQTPPPAVDLGAS